MNNFKIQVDEWILKSQELTEAVVKDAAQEMAISASVPVGSGGRMPVIDGFLRNSIAASINSLPSGENKKPKDYVGSWNPTELVTVINRMKLGDKLYIGWTAIYAQKRENDRMFMRTAAQNWPQFVAESTNKLKARMK